MTNTRTHQHTLLSGVAHAAGLQHGFNTAAKILAVPKRIRAGVRVGCVLMAEAKPIRIVEVAGVLADRENSPRMWATPGLASTTAESEHIEHAIAILADDWLFAWLPEIKHTLARANNRQLKCFSLHKLLSHLDETWDAWLRLNEILWLVRLPALHAMDALRVRMAGIAGSSDGNLVAERMTSGFMTAEVEADLALRQLSRLAMSQPVVTDILNQFGSRDAAAILDMTPAADDWMHAVRCYLQVFGHVTPAVDVPGQHESLGEVVSKVQAYLQLSDDALMSDLVRANVVREAEIAIVHEALAYASEPERAAFEHELHLAQTAQRTVHEAEWWCGCAGAAMLRTVFCELGRRLARATAIDRGSDVFWLTLDEVREAAQMLQDCGLKKKKMSAVVTRRKQQNLG